MGIARGPNIVKDDLVFGYDTGYGVADNKTVTRFYAGKPTSNLLTKSGASSLDVRTDIYNNTTKTDLGGGKYRFVNDGTGGSTIRLYTDVNDLVDGTTYGCSVSYENFNPGDGTAVILDWCDQNNTTFSHANYGASNRLFMSGTRSSYTSTFRFLDITLPINSSIVLFNAQVEVSTPSPYTDGTRTSTQSLIDLKRTTDIGVSNVSFDSTGQPTFDGTDDIIEVNRLISTSNYSAEFIFKADVNTSGTEHWLGSQYPGTGRVIFDLYTNNKLRNFINGTSINGATTIATGTWYHAVFTRDSAGAAKIYLNGVQDATGTLSTTAPVNDNFEIGGSTTLTRWLTGDIPVAKIYSKTLTAEEAQQNFNAYKNRFNI